jgi:hypothetical protein
MVGTCGGRGCSPNGRQEAEQVKKGMGPRYNLQRHTPSDIFPPKIVALPAEYQVFSTMSWETFYIYTVKLFSTCMHLCLYVNYTDYLSIKFKIKTNPMNNMVKNTQR